MSTTSDTEQWNALAIWTICVKIRTIHSCDRVEMYVARCLATGTLLLRVLLPINNQLHCHSVNGHRHHQQGPQCNCRPSARRVRWCGRLVTSHGNAGIWRNGAWWRRRCSRRRRRHEIGWCRMCMCVCCWKTCSSGLDVGCEGRDSGVCTWVTFNEV